jgi:hypothetical protein
MSLTHLQNGGILWGKEKSKMTKNKSEQLVKVTTVITRDHWEGMKNEARLMSQVFGEKFTVDDVLRNRIEAVGTIR